MRANILIITLCLISGMAWGGMQFNGTANQLVNCGSDAKFDISNGTISVWLKFNSLVGDQAIVSKDAAGLNLGDGQLWYDDTGDDRIQMSISDATTLYETIASTASLTNVLYHVVATFGAAGQKLYINSVLNGTNGNTTGWVNANNTLSIGNNFSANTRPAKMDIYNVAIYDKQFTASEVLALYNSYGNTTNRPIASYWGASGYSDGQLLPNGTVIGDFSGNNLSGTASNGVRQVSANPANGRIPLQKPRRRK